MIALASYIPFAGVAVWLSGRPGVPLWKPLAVNYGGATIAYIVLAAT